jgi:signal transduction histidine kinase
MDERTARAPVDVDLALYRRLVDASPVPLAVIAPDTTVHVWNPAAARLFGWCADEVLGRPIPIVPGSAPTARDGVAWLGFETQWRAKDDAPIDVAITVTPLGAEDDPGGRFLLVFEDRRERRRVDVARLRASRGAEERRRRSAFLAEASAVLASSLDYETTLDHVARLAVSTLADYCVIDVLGDHGHIRRVAAAHANPAMEPLAKQLRELDPSPHMTARVTRVITTGEPDVVTDLDLDRATGTIGDPRRREVVRALGARSYIVVALRARGATLGTMTFVAAESGRRYHRDDVELASELGLRAGVALDNARLHESERRARAAAETASRAKDEFLSAVSHELRTPLQAMLGWVAVLRQGKLGEAKAARALDIIEQSGRAQSRLIGDLLDVSRLATGRLRIEPRPVELPPVVQAAVDAVHPAAEAKRVHVRCLFDPSVGPVAGDPDRLQQIVWNLLSNAVKFTPEGGRVELRLERDPREVRIVVTDSGRGIAPDFLPYVFEPFRQAEDVRRRTRQGGVGLGLAIVRHLAELHGGRVSVESSGVGLGATFVVTLPLAPLDPAGAATESSDGNATHSHR